MNKRDIFWHVLFATICIVIGLFCIQIHTNLEFFNLIPTDSSTLVVPMQGGEVYAQTFTIQRKTMSRLGIYMKPLREISDFDIAVHVEVLRNGNIIGSGDIPAIFIENGGPAYITFKEPIATIKGQRVTMQITVPPLLSGSIALRERMYDESFSKRDIKFTISGAEQEQVIAYNVFESIRPAFMKQVGGILVSLGVALLFLKHINKHRTKTALIATLILTLLYAIPAWDASMSYSLFAVAVGGVLVGMWTLLRVAGRSNLAAVFGAAIFACSTWLPLHFITQGNIGSILSLRNALIDPNQIAITHGAGLYTGILVAIAACAGIIIWLGLLATKHYKEYEGETFVAIIGLLAAVIAFIPSPVANGHAGIVVSFAIAWFASFGMWRVERFLGTNNSVVRVVLIGLAIVTLLDLMYVTARTFTYGLGI